MIYWSLLPAVLLFPAAVLRENNSLRALQVLAVLGVMALLGFDLWFSGGQNLVSIVIPFVIAEIFHFVLLGTGWKVPFITHEFILLVVGLLPWFIGVTASFVFATIGIIGTIITVAAARQLLLPTIPESTTRNNHD